MIYERIDPEEKRKQLKERLKSSPLRFVGSFSPLVSRLIEKKGFDGIYVSGSVLSSLQGFPDIGLTTLKEVVEEAENITKNSFLPSLVDSDTGFGGAVHSARAVYEFEKRGLSGLHIEDQKFPKRCGHLDKKSLISMEEMNLKIQAAVQARRDKNFLIIARTDARAVEGLEAALERAKSYLSAGADMIFPEALESVKEFEFFRRQISSPLMANMTEFGKTEIIPYKTFEKLAYNLVIYPVSTWRLALKAVDEGLQTLFEDKQESLLPKMQTRQELYDLLEYESYNQFDKELFNFSLKKINENQQKNEWGSTKISGQALFKNLQQKVFQLDTQVEERQTKMYYSYRFKNTFLYVLKQKNRLKLYIGLTIEEVGDLQKMTKTSIQEARDEHYGHCDVKTYISSDEELSYILPFIKKALEKDKKGSF